jgi:hypothetical protein
LANKSAKRAQGKGIMRQSRLRLIGLTVVLSVLAACGGGADSVEPGETNQVSLPAPQAALVDSSNCDAAALTAGTFQFLNGNCVRSTNALQEMPSRVTVKPFFAAAPKLATDALLDWAEIQFPQLFAPSPQHTAFLGPYAYRYYPATQNFLGVAGEDIYVLGSLTGNLLTRVGSLSEFECQVLPQNCLAPGAPTIQFITPLDSGALITFSPPASSGSAPITRYISTCTAGLETLGGFSDSSPMTIAMRNGTTYSCTVRATNSFATGPASAPAVVTPAVRVVGVGPVEGIWKELTSSTSTRYLLVEPNGEAWGFSGDFHGVAGKTGAIRGVFSSAGNSVFRVGTVTGTFVDIFSFGRCSPSDPDIASCTVFGTATASTLEISAAHSVGSISPTDWQFGGTREASYATAANFSQVAGTWFIGARHSGTSLTTGTMTVDGTGRVNVTTDSGSCIFSGKFSPVVGKGYFHFSASSVIGNCSSGRPVQEIDGVAFVTRNVTLNDSIHLMWRSSGGQQSFWGAGPRR